MWDGPKDVEGECNARLFLGDDFGDNQTSVLTRKDISNAASRVLNARPGDPFKANDAITSYVRDRDIDSDAADVVIQVAMFNEIVYG